ncbi:uncharacterized protein DS421_15g505730 [Arachis hypogaea]|nr:uncharacterized protein DS421_15g505730 [Arachis hypogaea]
MLGLACHAFDTKWHAQSLLLLSLCIGMPRLVAQVARLSEVERLACHAFDFKWHAQSSIAFSPFSGLLYQRATPCCSSGTPMDL